MRDYENTRQRRNRKPYSGRNKLLQGGKNNGRRNNVVEFYSRLYRRGLKRRVYDHVQTRFPPEPNGYLHIGHAKAICINFGTAQKYGGVCNLRLDDTNPQKEDTEYVDAIKEDIEWLGFKWNKCLYASSYFDFIYECAVKLNGTVLRHMLTTSPQTK